MPRKGYWWSPRLHQRQHQPACVAGDDRLGDGYAYVFAFRDFLQSLPRRYRRLWYLGLLGLLGVQEWPPGRRCLLVISVEVQGFYISRPNRSPATGAGFIPATSGLRAFFPPPRPPRPRPWRRRRGLAAGSSASAFAMASSLCDES